MARTVTLAGLIIGIAGLLLQFYVSIQMSMAVGRTLLSSIEFFFSFFTVLTNILLVLVYAAALWGAPRFFARPGVKAGILVSITAVFLVYATILAQLWQPQGLLFIADTTLHYVAPILYILWWLGIGRTGTSRFSDIPVWLIYPFVYLGYAMVRGAIIGLYPYPFLDIPAKGLQSVIVSGIAVAIAFAVVGVLAVLADSIPIRRA